MRYKFKQNNSFCNYNSQLFIILQSNFKHIHISCKPTCINMFTRVSAPIRCIEQRVSSCPDLLFPRPTHRALYRWQTSHASSRSHTTHGIGCSRHLHEYGGVGCRSSFVRLSSSLLGVDCRVCALGCTAFRPWATWVEPMANIQNNLE